MIATAGQVSLGFWFVNVDKFEIVFYMISSIGGSNYMSTYFNKRGRFHLPFVWESADSLLEHT